MANNNRTNEKFNSFRTILNLLEQSELLKYGSIFVKGKATKLMSEEHKMTRHDKLVLGITLAAIFGGVFLLGLIGLIFNLSS